MEAEGDSRREAPEPGGRASPSDGDASAPERVPPPEERERPPQQEPSGAASGAPGGTAGGPLPASEPTDGFPRPVATFLQALTKAVQKYTMYPAGHPALAPTVEGVLAPLRDALRERPVLAIGIGSRQLAFEGVDSDPAHPRYSFLAGRLHRHQLATVTFTDGVSREELDEFLARVSVEADRSERPLGATPPEELPAWPHVKLRPIRYEHLGMATAATDRTAGAHGSEEASRSGRLWLGFARLALVREAVEGGDVRDGTGPASDAASAASSATPSHGADRLPDAPAPGATPSRSVRRDDAPESVARALEELSTEAGYAEEVLSQLVAISRELKVTRGDETEELRQRTSRLVSLVNPDALRRVLREGGDTSERRQLLLDASQWMEPGSVVKLVRATAGVEKQDISHWLLLMMSKLAQHAASGSGRVRSEAEWTLRDQVAQLVTDWALEDAVPEEYGAVLERMSRVAPGAETRRAAAIEVESERLLMLGLELDATSGPVLTAVDEMLEAGRFTELFEILERAPTGSRAAETIWDRVTGPEIMRRILAVDEPDFDAIDRLLARGDARVAAPMLETLANSPSRGVRRKLFSRLAGLGPEIGPLVVGWLDDERWFVRRNMLALVGELERWPRKWSPAAYAGSRHPAVRREALKLMLRVPATHDMAVRGLLEDPDPRSLALGLAAAQDSTPAEAIPLLLALAERPELPEELRGQAVRALAWDRTLETRDVLLRLVREEGGAIAKLFGRWRLAPRSPAMLEALAALHRFWGEDPSARRVLARAAKSDDEAVRAAAAGSVSR